MSGDSAAAGPAAAPLSVAQEAMWYWSRLAPTQLTYNETISIRKDGELDPAALRRAFAEIVRRHQAWRTTFEIVAGRPTQALQPPPNFALPLADLSELSPEEAERQAVRTVAAVSRIPYDLARGPLVRPRLFRFPGEHHRLYLAMHHLVFDGVSVTRVVLPELVALYDAFRAGRPSPLPEPGTRYADYARWEQGWIEEPRAGRRLDHWRERLTPLPELPLPLDHPRPEQPQRGGGSVPLSLPREDLERLRTAGQSAGASLFQVLAGCWALLLSRYSGRSEVVFSTAADLRQRPELQMLVGCCLTPLVLRVELDGAASFAELLRRVRNELLDSLDQLIPFERVVRELPPAVASGANPVYQTMLVLEPATEMPDPEWSLHQIDSPLADAVGGAKLDLELQLDERADGHLSGQLIYDRDLFERETARRIADHWLLICTAVAADPAAALASIPTLSAAERRRLVEWNATALELPAGGFGEPIAARARELAVEALGEGGDAVLLPDGEEAALSLAAGLIEALAIGPDETVLVLRENLRRTPAVDLWMPLLAGARIVLAPPGAETDGAAVSRLLRAEKVSFMHAAPRTWETLLDSGLRASRALRVLSGGEPLSPALATQLLERYRALWNAYGSATTAGYRTLGRVERDGPVTIGRPLANSRAYVLDRDGQPLPVGVEGELALAGPGLAGADPDPSGAGTTRRSGERARWLPDGRLLLLNGVGAASC